MNAVFCIPTHEMHFQENHTQLCHFEKNGELTIHTSIHEPWKEKVYGNEYWINGQFINSGEYLVGTVIHDDELLKKYEHLTWDDEPVCIKSYSDDEMCAKYFGEGK